MKKSQKIVGTSLMAMLTAVSIVLVYFILLPLIPVFAFLEYDPATGDTTTSDIFSAVDGEHQLIEMGANLVVFPEKVVVNTLKKNVDGQFNDIQELEFTNVIGNEFAYQLCDINGNVYSVGNIGNTAPSSQTQGRRCFGP